MGEGLLLRVELLAVLHLIWSALVAFVMTLGAILIGQHVALRSHRKERPTHWAEAARLLFPARTLGMLVLIVGPVCGASLAFHAAKEHAFVAPMIAALVVGCASLAGGLIGSRRVRRASGMPQIGLRDRVTGFLGGLFVLYPLLAVSMTSSSMMPSRFDWKGAVWVALFAAATWACTAGYGLRLGKVVGLVKPAPPTLKRRIDEMAASLRLPPVESYVIRMNQLNAFAIPHCRMVAVTDGLLRQLSEDETAAVCAHELGHVAESAAVIRKRKAVMWMAFVIIVGFYVMRGMDMPSWAQLIGVVGLLYVRKRCAAGFSRAAEEEADRFGKSQDREPGDFARALEKLYRVNSIPAVLKGQGQSHPHLYDRLVALDATPDYPRPEPPSTRDASLGQMAALVFVAVVLVGVVKRVEAVAAEPGGSRERLVASVVLGGPDAQRLAALARRAYDEDDYVVAGRMYTHAANLLPKSGATRLNAALAWSMARNCEDAAAALAGADQLAVIVVDDSKAGETLGYSADWYELVRGSVGSCSVGAMPVAH